MRMLSSIASVCPAEPHWADSRWLSVPPTLEYSSIASAVAIPDARAGTGLMLASAEATTASKREGRSSSLTLPNYASLDDASVCSPMNSLSDYCV